MKTSYVTNTQHLIRDNVAFLRQGIALLRALSDEHYCRARPPLYESNVGAHFRHVYDHYQQLLAGLEGGRVDYDHRQRDPHMAADRSLAIAHLTELIAHLERLASDPPSAALGIRLSSSASSRDEEIETPSTLARELQFLVSHTVHHYALIAFILRSEGLEIPRGFGVSPSTLEYQDGQARHAAC
ncbi:MAG: DinB family protein [Pseudomonadota bacterium]